MAPLGVPGVLPLGGEPWIHQKMPSLAQYSYSIQLYHMITTPAHNNSTPNVVLSTKSVYRYVRIQGSAKGKLCTKFEVSKEFGDGNYNSPAKRCSLSSSQTVTKTLLVHSK